MNRSHPLLLHTLLVLLLLAGQSFFVFHEVESLSPAHTHTAECIVTFFEHNTSVGCSGLRYVVDIASSASFTIVNADIVGVSEFQLQPIRAPPSIT